MFSTLRIDEGYKWVSSRRAGPTTAFGRVVGRQAYAKICAAAMGIAAPIELQRSSGFIITQLAVDVR